MWTIIGIITFIAVLTMLVLFYIHDRKFEKKRPSETMSTDMWDEIAKEKEETLLKAKRFKAELEKAKKARP